MSEFQLHKAVRKNVPLLTGIAGPSGGGKTYSALRLATGVQRVVGGRIAVIDTEADRALHYADVFDFDHLPFDPPFSPSRYLKAIKHCNEAGAKVVVVDSMSLMHEGEGGVLDMHDAELQRMGGHPKNNFRAWAKPKAELNAFRNGLLQMRCNFIFCFRAKEKAKPDKKGGQSDLKDMGWMAIASPELVFEMTAMALLLPNADGVPTWNPEREGERAMVKQPSQFRGLFKRHAGKPLSEEMGEEMARWAAGGASPAAADESFRFPRGEHQGKTVQEVPAEYLTTLAEHPKTPAAVVERCQDEIERRIREESP